MPSAAAPTSPAAPPVAVSAPDKSSRQFWQAAAAMTALLVVLMVAYVALSPDTRESGVTKAEQTDAARTASPDIITKPSQGRAPESPGDPGGWQQLVLFGVILGGMATIGGLAWRSSRKARSVARA